LSQILFRNKTISANVPFLPATEVQRPLWMHDLAFAIPLKEVRERSKGERIEREKERERERKKERKNREKKIHQKSDGCVFRRDEEKVDALNDKLSEEERMEIGSDHFVRDG